MQAIQSDKPSQDPPAGGGVTAQSAEARPQLDPSAAGGVSAAEVQAAPTTPIPEAAATTGVTVWVSNKTFNALWSINQNRNSWVGVVGVGWKRLSTASDSGIMALSLLSAHAREKNATVNYRDEADGLIHEMYVW